MRACEMNWGQQVGTRIIIVIRIIYTTGCRIMIIMTSIAGVSSLAIYNNIYWYTGIGT